MDILLYLTIAIIAFVAGRGSAPVEKVEVKDLNDKERKEYDYQRTLNQSLLTEVQQYRVLETKLRGELWEIKKQLKKLQQNS
jgi:hypothetical protein